MVKQARLKVGLVFLLLLLSFAVLGQSAVDIAVIDNEITTVEEASFQVTVTNDNSGSRTYTLYGLDVVWSVTPEDKKFTLPAGASKTTPVRIKPLGPFQPSTYGIKLYIDSSPSDQGLPRERYTRDLQVILYPEEPLTYLPAIKVILDLPETVDPQQPLPVRLQLENRNPLDLTGLTVRIDSEMPEFNQQVTIDLPPLGQKTVDLTINPNRFQAPKQYTLFFILEHQGQPVKVVEKKVQVQAVTSPFRVERREEALYLKRFIELTVTNDGNVLNTQEVLQPLSFWEGLLAQGEFTVRKEQGQRQAVWKATLAPAESTTLTYVINYRLPAYFLAALLLVTVLYFALRSPLQLQKKANTLKGGEEGTLSEIKVTLEIRNRSKRHVKDVKVTDTIPGIANLEKGLEVGTLTPHEVRHGPQGSRVIWSISELEPLEQRLITYKLKARLGIIGAFSLPRATAEYRTVRGRKGKTYSNLFSLGG